MAAKKTVTKKTTAKKTTAKKAMKKTSAKKAATKTKAPKAAAPVGPYTPVVRAGDWVIVSGQLGLKDGVLAKGVISVDHISGGRFEMGLGSGWHDQEAKAFGVDWPTQGGRFKVMESQLQALEKWRRGERVTQSSPGVELVDAAMVPGPLGPMPIWIGGLGREKTLRMAGRYADGWNAAYVPADEYRELNGVLDDWCAKAGREPSAVERSINLSWGLSTDDVSVVKERLRGQWGAAAERIINGSLLGRPQDAVEQVARFVDAGAQLVNVAIRPPWDEDLLREYVEVTVPLMRREFDGS